MPVLFSADMMDLNPSLNSSGFFQAILSHSATLAVSPLRPNGLNDLDVCLSTLEWSFAHPEAPHGFSIDPLPSLSPDATAVEQYNHKQSSDDLLIVIQAVTSLKAYALSLAGSTITSTLKHPVYGFTKLKLTQIIDHVKDNYGVLSRSDISTLDSRMSTYDSNITLSQNFTVFDQTHELLKDRGLQLNDIRKLDNLYAALQTNLTQKARFDMYLAQHPNRINQSYIKAKKYLLQLERSMSDIPISTLLPPSLPLPSVAAAAIASTPPPTASEFAALKRELQKLQKEMTHKASSPAASVAPSPTRTSTPCRQCAALSPPIDKLYSKCKVHNPYAK